MHVIDSKFMRDKNDFRVIHTQFYVNGNTVHCSQITVAHVDANISTVVTWYLKSLACNTVD